MKIKRSSKLSFKFCNREKLQTLRDVITEYGRVVNFFIDLFWDRPVTKSELLRDIVNLPDTWLSARLRKVAAREALDMIGSVRNQKKQAGKPTKPVHAGKRITCSSTIASLQTSKTTEFDAYLHLSCIGSKTILDLPVRFHRHFNKWNGIGTRLESYIITEDGVQLCFEIETGPKKEPVKVIGIDTGINALATTSDGTQYGTDIKAAIQRVKRCRHGSKGQRKAVSALRQRIAEVAKTVVGLADMVVIEKLTGITVGTSRRGLGRETRYLVGRWNLAYWVSRIQMYCEETNVSFRTVSPRDTSRKCSVCGCTDQRNRMNEVFRCIECGHTDNADCNAARNILDRFLTGPYGAGCKPCHVVKHDLERS